MRVKDFGCLLINNTRSRAYIQKLISNQLEPQHVVLVDLPRRRNSTPVAKDHTFSDVITAAFFNRKYFLYSDSPQAILPPIDRTPKTYASFNPKKNVRESLEESGVSYEMVVANSLNDRIVIDTIADTNLKYILFSGGAILRKEILSLRQKFIHIHPGWVPNVKGSMAIEWSILTEGRCAASAFFMAEGIDEGDILACRKFEIPKLEHKNIPALYSSHIRSELLLDIVGRYAATGSFESKPQDPDDGTTYYKMHPALNNVVFDKCIKKGIE